MKNALKILLMLILTCGCEKVTVRKVKKLSPIPIYFVANLDKNPADGVTTGQFYYSGKIGEKIVIEERMPASNKICSILHEIKHLKCLTTFCRCYESEDDVLQEEHAYKFVLAWLLVHQQKDLLEDEMNKLHSNSTSNKLKEHKKASINVQKSRLWKTCEYFLSEE